MTNITNTIEVEAHGNLFVPKDPWAFGTAIERHQDSNLGHVHNILFNKGRYFETSIYNADILREVSELTKIPVQYNNMIVGSWKQMEDFVAAMNCLGFRVRIKIDWV